VPSQPSTNTTHVITLQTDCLMTNPETLKTKTLHDAYAEFWDEVSDGSLKLNWFFAKQALHGGFVSRRVNKQNYKPFLLTDRGSTFVLEVVDQTQANAFLKTIQEQPLPSASWLPKDWNACPFLPHVGYGEVVIDLNCHTVRKPQ